MMARRVGAHAAMLTGFAAGGLLAGHSLHYVLEHPDPVHLHHVLAFTGHGYLSWLVAAAVAAVVAAAAAWVVLGARRARTAGAPPRWTDLAVRLAALQSGGFLVLEPLERAVMGASLHDLSPRFLLAGVALQIAVACVAASVLFVMDRAAARIGRAATLPASLPVAAPGPILVPPTGTFVACEHLLDAVGVRGPPAVR